MEGRVIYKFSKVRQNRLLNRVQMCVDVFHPSVAKIPNESIREYMRSHFKKPHVSVFGVKKYYGGSRTRGYCVIYDNEESMKKYEPNFRSKRVALEKLSPAEKKKASGGKKEGRKIRKVKGHQLQKKRGTVRKQTKRLAQKQGKKKK
jgi:small subunit ribosomal protein S24e